jgi:hypothetical protein
MFSASAQPPQQLPQPVRFQFRPKAVGSPWAHNVVYTKIVELLGHTLRAGQAGSDVGIGQECILDSQALN